MEQAIAVEQGSGSFTPGFIRTMSQIHLVQIETIWQGMLRETQQPDMGWSWSYKLRLAASESRYEAYVIEIDKLAHGVMLLETEWHRTQLDSQGIERYSSGDAVRYSYGVAKRSPLVYVEYLASAPWNRRVIEDPPYFVGIGRTLLMFARQRSVELGYGGRVGLHSISESEAFYHRQGMPDYGADSDRDGLVYFEYGTVRQ